MSRITYNEQLTVFFSLGLMIIGIAVFQSPDMDLIFDNHITGILLILLGTAVGLLGVDAEGGLKERLKRFARAVAATTPVGN